MTTFLYGDVAQKRGVWMGYRSQGQVRISYSCPSCGAMGHIDPVDVRADGGVSAITVCTADCGWAHAGIVLERWRPLAS